ncbi:c-type cytochrome [Terriglobus albidus]|uniref:c-type cytochrome n=1 Tax=Terriglobus albidus TaxID=1592106 RepID=UPI0021DF4736|nr:c-type cytochrome [Terriglobus albidus]
MKNVLFLITCASLLAGCHSSSDRQAETSMRSYGCTSCHTIPGVAGAHSYVGPPLDRFGNRTYIAGILPNNPQNLSYWLQHPQSVHPGSAMPEMHLTQQDADRIAAYLERLH